LQKRCALPETQFGVIPGRSTADALQKVVDYAHNRQRLGKATYAAFMDSRKAFNTVPRDQLLDVLRTRFEISPSIFNLLRDILELNIIRMKKTATISRRRKFGRRSSLRRENPLALSCTSPT